MSREKIGKDEWVASYEQRVARGSAFARLTAQVPFWGWIAALALIGVSIPLLTANTYALRVAGTIALMATFGLGLNLVVGYAGLLDLGFVAFYGIGAYTYAYLSSDFSGVHLPTWLSLPIIIAVSALFGVLLGLPSLRLYGDYLAIVTLGFGQIFVQLTTSLTRVSLPGLARPVNLTGGPNGIPNLDNLSLLGFTAQRQGVVSYYYILLAALVIVTVAVYHVNHSRFGRAWRSLREDELAANAMGMPTRRLKLLAFASGAAIAGLSGALFAAWQGAVFPSNFDITVLITLYAVVVLGGLGSLPGVIVGAVIMIAMPEVLRNSELAAVVFYFGVLITLAAVLRPRWMSAVLIATTVIFGVVVKIATAALWPTAFAPLTSTGSALVDALRNWLAIPIEATRIGNLAFGALLAAILLVSRLKDVRIRMAALVPTLYLLAFVWETRLSQEPSVTRLLFVGVLLIVLMIYRPNGLFGQRRVEVV